MKLKNKKKVKQTKDKKKKKTNLPNQKIKQKVVINLGNLTRRRSSRNTTPGTKRQSDKIGIHSLDVIARDNNKDVLAQLNKQEAIAEKLKGDSANLLTLLNNQERSYKNAFQHIANEFKNVKDSKNIDAKTLYPQLMDLYTANQSRVEAIPPAKRKDVKKPKPVPPAQPVQPAQPVTPVQPEKRPVGRPRKQKSDESTGSKMVTRNIKKQQEALKKVMEEAEEPDIMRTMFNTDD